MDDLTFYINKHKEAYEKRRREEEAHERENSRQKENDGKECQLNAKNKCRVEAKDERRISVGNNLVNRKNASMFPTQEMASKFSRTSISVGIKQRIADNVIVPSIPNIALGNNIVNREERRLRNVSNSAVNQAQKDRSRTQEEKDYLFAIQLNEQLNGPNSFDHLLNQSERVVRKANINSNGISEKDSKYNAGNFYGEEGNIRAPDNPFVECLLGSDLSTDHERGFNHYYDNISESVTPRVSELLSRIRPSDLSSFEMPHNFSASDDRDRQLYMSELDEHLPLFRRRSRQIPRWACRHPCIITCREEECDDDNEYFNGWEDEEERFNLLDYVLRTEERAWARVAEGARNRERERLRARFFQRTSDDALEFQKILDLLLGRNRECDVEVKTNEASDLEVVNEHSNERRTEIEEPGKRGCEEDIEKEIIEDRRKIKIGNREGKGKGTEGNEEREEKRKETGETEEENETENKRERKLEAEVEGRYVTEEYLRDNIEIGMGNERKRVVKNEAREKQKPNKTMRNVLTYSYIKEGDNVDYNDDSFIFNAKEVTNRMVMDLKRKYAILENVNSNNNFIPLSTFTNINADMNNENKSTAEKGNHGVNILNTFNNLKCVEGTNYENVTVQMFENSYNRTVNNERTNEVDVFAKGIRLKTEIGNMKKPYYIKNQNNEGTAKLIRESGKNTLLSSKERETNIKNTDARNEIGMSKIDENGNDTYQVQRGKKKYIYTCLIKKDDISIKGKTKKMKETQKLEKGIKKDILRKFMDITNELTEVNNKEEEREKQKFLNKYMKMDKERCIMKDCSCDSQTTEELKNELELSNEVCEHEI